MPYVPPHLRKGAESSSSDAPPADSRSVGRSYSSNALGGASRGDFGSFGSRSFQTRDRDGGGYRDRDSAGSGITRRALDIRGGAAPEAVWPTWRPSDRVIRLQEDQVGAVHTC